MSIRRFKLPESFLEEYRHKEPDWGFLDDAGNSLGEITFIRSYSRLKEDGTKEKWVDTCQRVIEGEFTIQREHCYRNRLPWDHRKAQRTAQDSFDRMFHFKWLPPGRGIANMGASFILDDWDGTALQNPLHIDTPVYTKNGWVPLGNLAGQKDVELLSTPFKYARDSVTDKKTIGSGGIWVKADVSEIQHQPSMKVTYRLPTGQVKTVIASENHRWFVSRGTEVQRGWKRIETTELREGDRFPMVKPGIHFNISKVGQQHGFFFGDGSRQRGELPQFGDSIAVLSTLFGDSVRYFDRKAIVSDLPLAWSRLPEGEYLAEKKYVLGFLSGYFAADGCTYKNGDCIITSARKEELEKVQELFERIGISTCEIRLSSQCSNYAEYRELWSLRIDKYDLFPEFFLKSQHRERWLENVAGKKRSTERAIVLSIEPCGIQPVLCATVPDYEQFVIDGFVLTSNCAFVSTKTDFSDAMHFLMLASMNGVGVGLDTLGAGRINIKQPLEESALYVIPDTREGWAEALKLLLDSYLQGRERLVFDYSEIRPAGAFIKRFGGTASGPGALKYLLEWISELLESRIGTTLSTTDIADIANQIGCCVVSGSSRRSAELLVGPQTDEYLDLKNYGHLDQETGQWIDGPALKRKDWAWMSNNSIFAEVGQNYAEIAKRTVLNGEPGYVWMDTTRQFGRLKDPMDNKDWRSAGYNPCAEQPLESYEACTLTETFPTRHDSIDDYLKTLKVAYLYAKTVTLLPTVFERTNSIMARNRRIGLSQSGITTYVEREGIAKWRQLCDAGYKYINGSIDEGGRRVPGLDDIYSEWLCVRNSIRTTTVKPSGTVSLLSGDSPGIHWNPASGYYIRRVTMGPSPLLDAIREAGYSVKESTYSKGQFVVEFPIKSPFARSEKDVTIWEKVAMAAEAQHWWSDNSVSVTVSYNKETEGQYIEHILSLYEGRLKTVSFLPISTDTYVQMPYEEISEERYNAMCENLLPMNVDSLYDNGVEAEGEKFCTTTACEVGPKTADDIKEEALHS